MLKVSPLHQTPNWDEKCCYCGSGPLENPLYPRVCHVLCKEMVKG